MEQVVVHGVVHGGAVVCCSVPQLISGDTCRSTSAVSQELQLNLKSKHFYCRIFNFNTKTKRFANISQKTLLRVHVV